MEHSKNTNAWYERTGLVIFWCFVFLPVGLYALWRNSTIGKGWKIGVTVFVTFIIIINAEDEHNNLNSSSDSAKTNESLNANQPEQVAQESIEPVNDVKKQSIISKLKEKAKRDWPDDYTTQEFWVNQEADDYDYMLTIEDNSIKRKAQRDWPLDFTTQKFWYNQQLEARERLK